MTRLPSLLGDRVVSIILTEDVTKRRTLLELPVVRVFLLILIVLCCT